MATTISVSDDTRKALMRLKLREGQASLDELLRALIAEHQSAKLQQVQGKLGRRARKLGITAKDIYPDLLE